LSGPDLAKLLPDIVAIAREAGAEIMKIYSGAFDVRTKSDASPLTAADDVSEELILARLAALTPDIPIASEEAIARGGGEAAWAATPERFWLVDPLDGTREFVSRNGEFSVNIGLIVARRPALGVVLAPATGETWAGAGLGTATFTLGSAAPKAIRARRMPEAGAVVLESRSHGDRAAVDAYLGDYKVAERRAKGSALKFGVLAQGEADLYPRFGPTMEWDTAAGHAVVEAAGGRVETLAGGPLLYGKTGLRNPDFIARGAP
jgi:3'(2'), 5'-bisphosphate nucleotidase